MTKPSRSTSTLIFSAIVLALSAHGQSTQSRSFSWNGKTHSMVTAGRSATLELSGLEASRAWVVGVEVAKEASVSAGTLQFDPAGSRMPLRALSGIADIENIRVSPGKAIVDVPSGKQPIFVHLLVPAATEVTIVRDGEQVIRATPEPSLLIENGRLASVAVNGRHSLIMRAVVGQRSSGQSAIVQTLPTGEHVVGLPLLKSHLLSWAEPDPSLLLRSEAIPVGKQTALQIEIDAAGRVTSVSARAGGDQVLRVYGSVLRNWRFRPFTKDGAPVAVKAFLPFFVASDGIVKHALHPSVSLASPAAAGDACCKK